MAFGFLGPVLMVCSVLTLAALALLVFLSTRVRPSRVPQYVVYRAPLVARVVFAARSIAVVLLPLNAPLSMQAS